MGYKNFYLARRNPTIREEDWPRTWRSHAVFASQFATIGSRFDLVMYAARVYGFESPGFSTRYDGVGVLALPARMTLGSGMSPEVQAKIDQDERRVFAELVRTFAFESEETLVEGGEPGAAAVIAFHARSPGTTKDDFLRRWSGPHAALGRRAREESGALRYVQGRLIAEPPPGYPFEGVSEWWYADADAAKQAATGALAPVIADLSGFCDPANSPVLLTRAIHRWPKAA